MEEIWKDIEGYDGLYQVSNMGNVKSLISTRGNSTRILKQAYSTNGYLFVNLYKDKKQKPHRIHRLVGIAFLPNPENKPQINHIDGNKNNNTAINLEWATGKENVTHAIDTKLFLPHAENSPATKLKNIDVIEIRKLVECMSQADIARKFNVSETTISRIKNKISWTSI